MASLREVIDISKHYNILDAAQAAKAVRNSQAKARTQARKKNTGRGEKYINKATGNEATKDDDYGQKNTVSENKARKKLKKIGKTSKKERKRNSKREIENRKASGSDDGHETAKAYSTQSQPNVEDVNQTTAVQTSEIDLKGEANNTSMWDNVFGGSDVLMAQEVTHPIVPETGSVQSLTKDLDDDKEHLFAVEGREESHMLSASGTEKVDKTDVILQKLLAKVPKLDFMLTDIISRDIKG